MTSDAFRKLALKIAGAVEAEHMNHPDFRLGGKIFATLAYPDDEHGMVRLNPQQQRQFVKKAPAVFTPCSGAWGRQGCTSVLLQAATRTIISAALNAAVENIVIQPKPVKRKTAYNCPD